MEAQGCLSSLSETRRHSIEGWLQKKFPVGMVTYFQHRFVISYGKMFR